MDYCFWCQTMKHAVTFAPLDLAALVILLSRHTPTWRALGPGASSDVDDGLVRRLGEVGPQRRDADALGQLDLAVALLDDLHLPGALQQKQPVHSHSCRLAHLVHPAGRQLVQSLRAVCSSRSPASHLLSDQQNHAIVYANGSVLCMVSFFPFFIILLQLVISNVFVHVHCSDWPF